MGLKRSGLSPALAALTTAAMTLPGISTMVKAGVVANEPKLSLQYTRYDEIAFRVVTQLQRLGIEIVMKSM